MQPLWDGLPVSTPTLNPLLQMSHLSADTSHLLQLEILHSSHWVIYVTLKPLLQDLHTELEQSLQLGPQLDLIYPRIVNKIKNVKFVDLN
jgi:hypothetical protein